MEPKEVQKHLRALVRRANRNATITFGDVRRSMPRGWDRGLAVDAIVTMPGWGQPLEVELHLKEADARDGMPSEASGSIFFSGRRCGIVPARGSDALGVFSRLREETSDHFS